MNSYIIKPYGYPFEVEVTEAQLKEYTEEVAASIKTMIDRLDEVQAFYEEEVTIGELWPWTEWEGMEYDLPYEHDSIVFNGVEKRLKSYIDDLELTYEDKNSDEWCDNLATALFNAIINK